MPFAKSRQVGDIYFGAKGSHVLNELDKPNRKYPRGLSNLLFSQAKAKVFQMTAFSASNHPELEAQTTVIISVATPAQRRPQANKLRKTAT